MNDREKAYRQIFDNNRRWVAQMRAGREDYFDHLAEGQSPDYLYIGCADSRVPANDIMGLEPGEVFVHRNIANLVVNTDMNAQGVIQYAVEVLHVKDIIVCGHYGCGGVKAAMKPADMGLLNGWLREIRDVYRMHVGELHGIEDEETRYKRLIELNVMEQCVNVIKTASVQKHWLKHGYPVVHGWVFDLHDGLLKDLEVPFEDMMNRVQQLYRLDPE
ncbi:MAG: carbonic anhydrase [Alphaproteobacteria bacterium]|nr:carbonic anhydrase [Alphaproteobacteria bacterium]MCB9695228.1 carbonic anhydrase [Alphaproteobacteria bacterium]